MTYLINREKISIFVGGIIYLILLVISIIIVNGNSTIHYSIQPYTFGSEFTDFIFPMLVTIPFSYQIYFLVKNNGIDYIGHRVSKKEFIVKKMIHLTLLSGVVIFFVNLIGVGLSVILADITENLSHSSLINDILGQMQMSHPLIFGVIWSFHKSLVGMLICLFSQIIALYIRNIFVVLVFPFIYVLLENFITAILRIPEYSLTTTFVLNRLSSDIMSIQKIYLSILFFVLVICMTAIILRRLNAKKL